MNNAANPKCHCTTSLNIIKLQNYGKKTQKIEPEIFAKCIAVFLNVIVWS